LSEGKIKTDILPTVSPSMIAPGKRLDRLGVKKPKCFFALFKSFIGASLMGLGAIPEKSLFAADFQSFLFKFMPMLYRTRIFE